MNDERNELVRKILQHCAACTHFKKDASCDRKRGQCPNKKVKKYLDQIERIDKEKTNSKKEVKDATV